VIGKAGPFPRPPGRPSRRRGAKAANGGPGTGALATMTAGDFVRNIKQLCDLLRQLVEVLPDPASAEAAKKAAQSLFRGIVAASSVVEVGGAVAGHL
jgi:hypothetical protein